MWAWVNVCGRLECALILERVVNCWLIISGFKEFLKRLFTIAHIISSEFTDCISWGRCIYFSSDCNHNNVGVLFTDWVLCSRPCQLGKVNRPLFVISNRCIRVKNTLHWSAVVFCACEIIRLFSLSFCVFRAVHKFNFRLVIKERRDKWRPVGHAETEAHSFGRICMFSPTVVANVKGLCPLCTCQLLGKVRRFLYLFADFIVFI
jgi:hypothetical protein